MSIVGYLEIPDIPGEARASQHRDQIEIHGIAWQVAQAASASPGSGRRSARAEVGPITVDKFCDAASPHLALAAMNGRSFQELRLSFEAAADDHFDYLRIRLQNCLVTRYEVLAPEPGDEAPGLSARRRRANAETLRERVSFDFEHIEILYTEQAADGSTGAEHEVEYDVAARA